MIFLREQLLHLPFEHEQVGIIGLVLSVTTSSCQRGTNELSGSGFQPSFDLSSILVLISLRFQKQPAWIHACFIWRRIPDGDGTRIRRFRLGVELRSSFRRILKDGCFVKPYASQTKLHNVSNSFTSMFIGQLLNFLKILANVVSPTFSLANQTAQNLVFSSL